MVRIKEGNYIAIFYDRMIEVNADSKYQFKWGQSGKGISEGYAYIFD